MLRKIGGVIAGYVVMALFVFLSFTLAYLAMGADGAFRPGTYDVSGLWVAAALVLSLAAAVLGGWVCVLVARSRGAAVALAVVVLVLGLLMVLPVLMGTRPEPGPRAGEVGNLQAMSSAQQPLWLTLLNPVLGAAGTLAGARLGKGSPGR
jgi:hypothetical protein